MLFVCYKLWKQIYSNKLLKNIISQLTEKIKENLMDNVMNIIELNGENIDKYIQYDK